jgi:amidase
MPVPVPVPDAARLGELNRHYGFGLTDVELREYAGAVAATFGASERVEELYAASAPQAPEGQWSQPADNPLGAWYVTTSISGAAEGPLAGARSRSRTT